MPLTAIQSSWVEFEVIGDTPSLGRRFVDAFADEDSVEVPELVFAALTQLAKRDPASWRTERAVTIAFAERADNGAADQLTRFLAGIQPKDEYVAELLAPIVLAGPTTRDGALSVLLMTDRSCAPILATAGRVGLEHAVDKADVARFLEFMAMTPYVDWSEATSAIAKYAGDLDVCGVACRVLARCRRSDIAVPALLSAPATCDVDRVRALGAFGSRASAAVPQLREYMQGDGELAVASAIALFRITDDVEPSLGVLRGYLASADVLCCLASMRTRAAALAPALLPIMSEVQHPTIRAVAAVAYFRLTGDREQSLPVVLDTLRDADHSAYPLILDALPEFGAGACAALTILDDLTRDAFDDDERARYIESASRLRSLDQRER